MARRECPVCDLPINKGEPRGNVDGWLTHAWCEVDADGVACTECWLIHAPGQSGCW